ncbi:cation-transporting P-type ATPase [Ochrobactrum sp. CGA5]|uniref:P-type ATPase n=1 Tax=Ochrobactrum sp. CGA5 TaxID=2583453 RepID=UPI00111D89C7|nr:cation-transporting P-type ATPase [Ochrobactrum sp. CGA5]
METETELTQTTKPLEEQFGGPPEVLKAATDKDLTFIADLSPFNCCRWMLSAPTGLSSGEANERLRRFGPNIVSKERRATILQEIWGRLKNPLNGLLLTLAVVSYFLGDVHAAVVIVVMVLLAVATAFIQEHRSNEAATRLRAMVHTRASVRRTPSRNGDEFDEMPMESLVPGDIVRLSAGDMIPADLRLIETKDLFVNQSALTGEAMPVEKSADADSATNAEPFDISNLCFMGANVVSGYGTGVILRTGSSTFFGQIADELAGKEVPSAFDRGVVRFTWMMIRFILVMGPAVFLINGLCRKFSIRLKAA